MSEQSARAEQLAKIPETITRDAYLSLVEGLGFDVEDLISLNFHPRSVEAVVLARDENGDRYPADNHELATHVVSIKVVDA